MDASAYAVLADLTDRYRHVLSEHERAGDRGTVRRHMRQNLLELEEQFEEVLAHWVPDHADRKAWRAHLHARGERPSEPLEQEPQLLFKGRSDQGSIVEVRRAEGREQVVYVDGALVERVEAQADLFSRRAPLSFKVDGLLFEEIFDASPASVEIARLYAAEPIGEPPWAVAPELLSDGLIDATFALTSRGRRGLDTSSVRAGGSSASDGSHTSSRLRRFRGGRRGGRPGPT